MSKVRLFRVTWDITPLILLDGVLHWYSGHEYWTASSVYDIRDVQSKELLARVSANLYDDLIPDPR